LIRSREHPDEKELHGAKEVDADQQGRKPEFQLVPERELQDEVDDRDEKTEYGNHKPGHRRQAERHL